MARAADAVARRDAQRIAREKAIHAALAEFFQARGEIDRIRAQAEQAAAPFEQAARDAVRALHRLGETRTGIADLTGLPTARVREYVLDDSDSGLRNGSTSGTPQQAESARDDMTGIGAPLTSANTRH